MSKKKRTHDEREKAKNKAELYLQELKEHIRLFAKRHKEIEESISTLKDKFERIDEQFKRWIK